MALWPQFCGGFYKALSQVISADTAINVFTETRNVPGSPKQITMYGTPGLVLQTNVGPGRNRGQFTQDRRTWTVIGSRLYERLSATSYIDRGLIVDDGKNVSFASNGRGGEQLAICGGAKIYVLDLQTNALVEAALPFSNPVMITFIDGYGLALEADSPIVWFSNLEDFLIWDALDFFTRSGTSDNIVGIAVTIDRVHVFGSKTKTMYYDSGDSDTPFVPYEGTTVQVGLVGANLLTVYADQLIWVATSARGDAYVVLERNTQQQTISTPPISQFLANCSTLSDAEILIYAQEDHTFVAFTCPSSPDDVQTYVYDIREQLWHARAGWNSTTGVFTRWRAKTSTSVDGQILVGDYENGNIYSLELDAYTDNGEVLVAERTAPYVGAENQWGFLDQFELGMQPGVGLVSGQGSAPVVSLFISRDSGHTFVSAGDASLGAIGAYTDRAVWRRLGRSRLDRLVMRVRQTDPVKRVWGPGAWLRLTEGTGQL